MFKAGDKVAEHLELVRLLGAGGMGSVWVARHLRLMNQVAVKFLSASLLDNPQARSRFDREAQWVAQLKSPHVVQVLDQGVAASDPPQPYIVMELLEGEDLGSLLDRVNCLGLQEAAHILDQACAGLAAAHAAGLVHRDIKPENLFLLAGDRPFLKILDFGIARATQGVELQRLTQTGGVIGTAHYMSPEQLFEGKQVDHRTDVWALGVVLYRMLTGKLPFEGNTYGDLCLAVNRGTYEPPSTVNALPPEVDVFLERALATDRNQRFPSVKEFALELNALAQRQSGVAPLPLGTGSNSGAVAAVTGGTQADAQKLRTDAAATVTVEALPMHRSGTVVVASLLAALVVTGAAFAAYKAWSAPSSKTQASAEVSLQSDVTPERQQAASAPMATPDDSASRSASDVPVSPSGVASIAAGDASEGATPPVSKRTPKPSQAKQKQATGTSKATSRPANAASGTKKTANQGSTLNNDKGSPPSSEASATTPPTSAGKYRGF